MQLSNVFQYDPTTGTISHTELYCAARAGKRGRRPKPAGVDASTPRKVRNMTYRAVYVPPEVGSQRRAVYAHRLAWELYHGTPPPADADIDHVNGDGQDNRISNLRCVSRAENLHNRPMRRGNKLLPGVRRCNSRLNPFYALIGHEGKQVYLGSFPDQQAAHEAYCQARKQHHTGVAKYGNS